MCGAALWTVKERSRPSCLHANAAACTLAPPRVSDAMVRVPRGPVRSLRQPQAVVDGGVVQEVPEES